MVGPSSPQWLSRSYGIFTDRSPIRPEHRSGQRWYLNDESTPEFSDISMSGQPESLPLDVFPDVLPEIAGREGPSCVLDCREKCIFVIRSCCSYFCERSSFGINRIRCLFRAFCQAPTLSPFEIPRRRRLRGWRIGEDTPRNRTRRTRLKIRRRPLERMVHRWPQRRSERRPCAGACLCRPPMGTPSSRRVAGTRRGIGRRKCSRLAVLFVLMFSGGRCCFVTVSGVIGVDL